MRLFLLLSLFLLLACATKSPVATKASASDINPDDLPEQQNGIRLPCAWHSELCFIPAKLNTSANLRLIVDTGSSVSVLNAAVAKRLKLIPVGQGVAAGSGDGASETYQIYEKLHLETDEFELKDQMMIGLAFDYVRKRTHQKTDGTIGARSLKNYIVEFNYERGDVVLFKPQTWQPDPGYESLPLEFEGDVPVVRAKVNGAEGRFLIDTGQIIESILVTPKFLEKNSDAFVSIKERKEAPVEAIGGRVDYVSGDIASVMLGHVEVQHVRAAFVKSTRGIYAQPTIAGGLGPKAFAHFDLIIDYPNRRLYFKRW